jgi:hypothetical protein
MSDINGRIKHNTMSTKIASDTTRTTASLLDRKEAATRLVGLGDGGYSRLLRSVGERIELLPRSISLASSAGSGIDTWIVVDILFLRGFPERESARLQIKKARFDWNSNVTVSEALDASGAQK